jgi:long-chain acyl-CoA synthetase
VNEQSAERLETTLPGRLALWAQRAGDRVALRVKRLGIWQEITWREYYEATRAVGHALWALGVRPGDHVALLSENRPEWLYVDLGAQGIGARSVGIYQTNPPPDVAYILAHSESVVLFCEDQEQVDKAVAVAAETPSVRHLVVFEPRATRAYTDPRIVTWQDFIARGEALAANDAAWFESRLSQLDPDAATMVVYTSGTTGHPKGAMLSSRNAFSQGPIQGALEISAADQLLSYLPLCHVAEKIFSVFIPMLSGCVMHFGESIDTVRDDIREVSPTVFLGVPRIWEKMHADIQVRMQDASWLKRKLFAYWSEKGREIAARRQLGPLGSTDRLLWALGDLLLFRPLQERIGLRRCRLPISGAAPISADLLRWFHGIGVPVLEGYGQTECAGVSHFNRPDRVRFGTVGQIAPTIECSLANDGEVLIRGSNVFLGYLHNAEATADTIDRRGWLHTGDIGSIDDDGYLTITGRKKEIIITQGGKNISPERIENALKMSPYINEAIAIGDARKFIAALVQIDYDIVGNWAAEQHLQYTSYTDLASKQQVRSLIAAEIDKSNELLAPVEQVKSFRILPKELNQDEGEMTATRKVRRANVQSAYGQLIESIYG